MRAGSSRTHGHRGDAAAALAAAIVAAILAAVAAALAAACGAEEPSAAVWPAAHPPVGGEGLLAYVSDNGSDTVSVVEMRTLRLLARRPVGLDAVQREAPHHLVAAPELGALFVGLSNVLPSGLEGVHAQHGGGVGASFVERRRLSDLAPAGFVRVDPNLGELLRVPGTTRVVASHFDLRRALDAVAEGRPLADAHAPITVVDGASMTRVATIRACVAPHGGVVTRTGIAAFACYGDDRVALLDVAAAEPALLGVVPVGEGAQPVPPPRFGPYAMTLAPDERTVYVGLTEGKGLRVLDLERLAMVEGRRVDLEGAAFFGALTDDGAVLYTPTQAADTIAAVDAATLTPLRTRVFEGRECIAPHVAAWIPAGRVDERPRLLLVCEGDHQRPGALLSLDPESLATLAEVELGVYPDGIAFAEASAP
jgi:hypothetical protein